MKGIESVGIEEESYLHQYFRKMSYSVSFIGKLYIENFLLFIWYFIPTNMLLNIISLEKKFKLCVENRFLDIF